LGNGDDQAKIMGRHLAKIMGRHLAKIMGRHLAKIMGRQGAGRRSASIYYSGANTKKDPTAERVGLPQIRHRTTMGHVVVVAGASRW
jgi:hypothetical protein